MRCDTFDYGRRDSHLPNQRFVQHTCAAAGDGSHREFLLARYSNLANQKNIEIRMERLGDFKCERNTASGKRQNQGIGIEDKASKPSGQDLTGLSAVAIERIHKHNRLASATGQRSTSVRLPQPIAHITHSSKCVATVESHGGALGRAISPAAAFSGGFLRECSTTGFVRGCVQLSAPHFADPPALSYARPSGPRFSDSLRRASGRSRAPAEPAPQTTRLVCPPASKRWKPLSIFLMMVSGQMVTALERGFGPPASVSSPRPFLLVEAVASHRHAGPSKVRSQSPVSWNVRRACLPARDQSLPEQTLQLESKGPSP